MSSMLGLGIFILLLGVGASLLSVSKSVLAGAIADLMFSLRIRGTVCLHSAGNLRCPDLGLDICPVKG